MYKSRLQELCQKRNWQLPDYTTVKEGPDHLPSFTSAVSVNGQTFKTPAKCKSAKESQNTAARIAFDLFSGTPPPADSPLSTLTLEAAANLVAPAVDPQPVFAASSPSPLPSPPSITPPDGLHLYKNLLQQYAQKENHGFPVYTSVAEGLAHDRHFKARVSIDGKQYESLEFFRTLKDAEHAAAKVACQVLSLDVVQEDRIMYKNLLQEFTHKKGLFCPQYKTVNSGLSHMPVFVSTVEIGTDTFRGAEAKTKKQAETNAAKVAYYALTEGCLAKESKVSSFNESSVADNSSQNVKPNATNEMHKDVTGCPAEESSMMLSLNESAIADNSSHSTQPIATTEIHQGCLATESSKVSLVTNNSSQNIQPTAIIETHQDIKNEGCPATKPPKISSVTVFHVDNSSHNIQPTKTIKMYPDETDGRCPATESSMMLSLNESAVADNSSLSTQPIATTEIHQGCLATESSKVSLVTNNSSQNIQPTAIIETHQDIKNEGCPATESSKISSVTVSSVDNSSQNIQLAKTIEMYPGVTEEVCPATESSMVLSTTESLVADNSSQNIQPTATIEMHQDTTYEGCPTMESSKVPLVTESPIADRSSKNIQPTVIIEMHPEISDEGCPATESSMVLSMTESLVADISSQNIQLTATIEMHQDTSYEGCPAMESSKLSLVTESTFADDSSKNIQPTAIIEMQQEISDEEAHPHAKRAKSSHQFIR